MIVCVPYEVVLPFWENHLWPGRELIEPVSAMLLDGTISMDNFDLPRFFLAAYEGGEVVGVNSGHLCSDLTFRSRGLWVSETHRGKGLGLKLLKATILLGSDLRSPFTWSLPRRTSWSTYEKAGFKLVSDWHESETSPANAFART